MKKLLPKRKPERKPSDEEFALRKSECGRGPGPAGTAWGRGWRLPGVSGGSQRPSHRASDGRCRTDPTAPVCRRAQAGLGPRGRGPCCGAGLSAPVPTCEEPEAAWPLGPGLSASHTEDAGWTMWDQIESFLGADAYLWAVLGLPRVCVSYRGRWCGGCWHSYKHFGLPSFLRCFFKMYR